MKTIAMTGFTGGGQTSLKLKFAFTLAEVLITLGIIGIVAAMTLPGLIQNYRKSVVENQLKTCYSLISNAVKMAEVEYGVGFEFTVSGEFNNDGNDNSFEQNEAIFNKYFKKYIKVTEEYPKNSPYFVSNGFNGGVSSNYGNMNKCVKLVNGTGLCFYARGGTRGQFYVFLKPNKTSKIDGRDVFSFRLDRSRGAFWTSIIDTSRYSKEELIQGCISESAHPLLADWSRADVCTVLIMQNNFTIPDDYPIRL